MGQIFHSTLLIDWTVLSSPLSTWWLIWVPNILLLLEPLRLFALNSFWYFRPYMICGAHLLLSTDWLVFIIIKRLVSRHRHRLATNLSIIPLSAIIPVSITAN